MFGCQKGGYEFMKNYDEILLDLINEDNADIVIGIILNYLSQLESS
jgi:hypothetical protein